MDLETSIGIDDLVFEENYHRNRLMPSVIDTIFHRVSPELKIWLEGGPKPCRWRAVSSSSRTFLLHCTVCKIAQDEGASSSNAPVVVQAEQPRFV